MMGAKVALTGLTLPERGRPPADVGRGGLPADTGRDGLGLHGSTVMHTPTRFASYDYLNVPVMQLGHPVVHGSCLLEVNHAFSHLRYITPQGPAF